MKLLLMPLLAMIPVVIQAQELHVMTFNIRYNNPGDSLNSWPYRKDKLASQILYHDIELLGVQEALIGQMEDLQQRLPRFKHLGVGRDGGTKGEHSAIFYDTARLQLLQGETFWLSETPTVIASKSWDAALTRIVTWAKFRDKKTKKIFFAFNTHSDLIAKLSTPDEDEPITEIPAPILQRPRQEPVREPVTIAPPIVDVKIDKPVTPPTTIEQKFITRKKVLVKEIPLAGDSVELQFYDNAEIDGDSISLFLNDRLIFQHIRLLGSAYTIKLPVKLLEDSNELTMVAENLGSIPPNTSYMIALVGDKRYDARLESTEGSSAMIRFVKAPPASQ